MCNKRDITIAKIVLDSSNYQALLLVMPLWQLEIKCTLRAGGPGLGGLHANAARISNLLFFHVAFLDKIEQEFIDINFVI